MMSHGTLRSALLRVSLAAAVCLAPGCSRATESAGEREVVYRADATITVRVVNRSQLDAVVYLVHDGARDRLGAVTAATASNFTVRTRSLATGGEFTLLADPVGSKRPTSTEVLRLSQGSVFTWTLETDFSRGAVMVQE
jgi:hypothetical protein